MHKEKASWAIKKAFCFIEASKGNFKKEKQIKKAEKAFAKHLEPI